MNPTRLGNQIRFPVALMVGIVAGFFANSMVSNGAFFVGGVALGTMVALWIFRWAEAWLGHSAEIREKGDRRG